MRRKLKLKPKVKRAGIIFLAVIVVLSGFLIYRVWNHNATLAQGLDYIQEQENKKVKELSSSLKDKKNAETESAIESGQVDVFALFDDAVIFGDSRVMGFSVYHFFPESHVLASSGATIKDISNWVNQAQSMNPSLIFFSYGVNDMGLDLDSEGGYDALYQSQIEQVVKVCPDATIVVNSIISATPAAIEKSPRWDKVDEYNKKIKAMCEKNDWIYVDNSEICQNGNADIYQADGVHFLQPFYTTWAENMIMTVRKQ